MEPEFHKAYATALRLLESRDRFEAEIARTLAAKGYEVQTFEVLERLRKQGIVNDRRVAEAIIMGREGRRGIGNELLRHRLLEKGAPEDLVEELLGDRDEAENAYQALAAKFGPGAPRAKAGRFLASRGFGEEAIESALERFSSSRE